MTHETGGGGAPPDEALLRPLDEGPGRRDLLRQIAALERRLSELAVAHSVWLETAAAEERAPSVLSMEELELVRDRLYTAIGELKELLVERERRRLDQERPG
jgi:hypothetical protein